MALGEFSAVELADISTKNRNDKSFKRIGYVTLNIDSLTKNPIIHPGYYENTGKEYFYHFNTSLHTLDIYDIKDNIRIKRISYPTEGPLEVSNETFAKIISFDSIYLFSRGNARVILTDTSGKQKNIANLPFSGAYLNVNMMQPFSVQKGKAVIAYQPPFYDNMLKDTCNYLIFDLRTNCFTKSAAKRPVAVTQFLMRGTDAIPRVAFGANGEVVNFFGGVPLIMRSNIFNKNVEYSILRGEGFDEPYKFPKTNGNQVLDQNQFMRDLYFMMCYDNYRNVYYLMYLHEEDTIDVNGDQKTVDEKRISIIIADSMMTKRGEFQLDRNKYFRSMLVTKDGLMVSCANPKNSNFEEDQISYAKFQLIKK